VVIETKMTRASLGAMQVGEQLILDIEHYKQHPDCGHLACLVYDPEGRISDPGGRPKTGRAMFSQAVDWSQVERSAPAS